MDLSCWRYGTILLLSRQSLNLRFFFALEIGSFELESKWFIEFCLNSACSFLGELSAPQTDFISLFFFFRFQRAYWTRDPSNFLYYAPYERITATLQWTTASSWNHPSNFCEAKFLPLSTLPQTLLAVAFFSRTLGN